MEPNVKLPNRLPTDFMVNYKFIKIDKNGTKSDMGQSDP